MSTARLLTVVIRLQILRHCVRQSTTHDSSITASPVVVLACTTLSRLSYAADLSPTAAQGRGRMKPLSGTAPSTTHAGISSTAVRSVRGVPECQC